jgi:anthraniloyl-CoA monooxygenase
MAPSPLPYYEGISAAPREMTRADMDRVLAEFVRSARFAVQAGFDMLELHMAHGYLLASFLSPLTNLRRDAYGGSIENRLRFPLEVLEAVRATCTDKPLSVRLSSSDWAQGGLTEDELREIARAMKSGGADLLDLSSGQTVPWQKPVYGRMWQTPFSDLVRNVVGIPTIAVGNIYEADHANSIIASGRADLCALARPHLADPAWTLRAAAEQHWQAQWWPPQYEAAKRQLERNLERAAQMTGPV